MPIAEEKAISDSSCAWRPQGCKEKPSGPAWLLLRGHNHHDNDSDPGTDTRDCTHKQHGAVVGPKGHLRIWAGSCTFERVKTRGGSPRALT